MMKDICIARRRRRTISEKRQYAVYYEVSRARGPPGKVQRPMLNLSPRTALVVHPSHATAGHWRMSRLLLGPLGHHRLGSNQQTCDRSRSLQCVSNYFRWVDDTLAR